MESCPLCGQEFNSDEYSECPYCNNPNDLDCNGIDDVEEQEQDEPACTDIYDESSQQYE